MKSIATLGRVRVSGDGHGVVSHAGMGMVRELADLTALSAQVTAVLADTYRGRWIYPPGAVFADLAAAVADGASCIDSVGQRCGDREHVFGAAVSRTTMWRLVDERRTRRAIRPTAAVLRRRRGRLMPSEFLPLLIAVASALVGVGLSVEKSRRLWVVLHEWQQARWRHYLVAFELRVSRTATVDEVSRWVGSVRSITRARRWWSILPR